MIGGQRGRCHVSESIVGGSLTRLTCKDAILSERKEMLPL